jgi:NAD(P)H dehydrogenase (quinone)
VFVIFGAAGNVGRATVAALRRNGKPVRAVVRDASQRAPLEALGCEVAIADLLDSDALVRVLRGAEAVQVVCPLPRAHSDPASSMRQVIHATTHALRAAPPRHVLALSDYGAELDSGTGITALFHELETQLRAVDTRLTFLRAAEHMHNWARVLPVALSQGVLPSLHHPLTKRFPTVAAEDVGVLAADLLGDDAARVPQPRVVSIESAERVSALDVARTIGELAGREVTAREVPRGEWDATLRRAGLSERHARLIVELYDAHNAGRIDVDRPVSEQRTGATTLAQALGEMLRGNGTGVV